MEKDKIFYKAEDFNKFDWSKLVYSKHSGSGENFRFGKGGNNYINGNGWQITIVGENGLDIEEWALLYGNII